MTTTTININGMTCSHCVAAVQKALATVPGLTIDAVTIGSATVSIDPATGSLAAAEAAIDDAGYDVVKGRVLNIASPGAGESTSDA
ncbi:MAG: heavy-metal-associated domain-containing protein [Gemmatimonadaceae bacterium]|nr:heavy-metal-associated domain-containing protein [Gemmatimonadaceae bacterium]